jgi:pre-mRNA-splicing helicase BRR2
VVVEFSLCWGLTMASHLTVIMGTQYYDGRDHRYVDCPITDIVQMMGRASRPLLDSASTCVIFCQSSKKEFYKKFLYEPFPVESHLDHFLADHVNAEIITKRIESVQDAVDYLTWSFFYRRITQNPNYYNLQAVSHRHLSDHLSELVENTLDDLQESKCVALETDEQELSALNLGMIAAYYYIKYTTVELFSSSLNKKSKLRGLLEIMSSASEFESIQVRHREDYALRKLAHHLPLKISDPGTYNDAHTKTNILLQAHFSRIPLSAAVAADQQKVLPEATRLLQAMVDVISSSGWLAPALATMELSQMVTQGMWNTDSPLLQLPHFDAEMAKKCQAAGVESVPDLIDLEDKDRTKLLALSAPRMQDIARACNNYPDIELKFKVDDADDLHAGGRVVITVNLERDPDDDEGDDSAGVPKVTAPRYPQVKTEGWWLVIGNPAKNELTSIKRIACKGKKMQVQLDFVAPEEGKHKYQLFLMSKFLPSFLTFLSILVRRSLTDLTCNPFPNRVCASQVTRTWVATRSTSWSWQLRKVRQWPSPPLMTTPTALKLLADD